MLILLVLISFFTLTLVFENGALRTMGHDLMRSSSVKCTHLPSPRKRKKIKDCKLWDCRNDGKWGGEVWGVKAGGERV